MVFDETIKKLGVTVTDAESALLQIDESFMGLYATAEKFGLDLGQIDVKKNAARLQVSKDFTKGIDRGLMSPLDATLADLEEERQSLHQNNLSLMAVQGHINQGLKIEDLYWKKRNEIMEQHSAASVAALKAILGSLDDYIKQFMPGGDLAGESAAAHLAGLQSSYGQARAASMASPLDQDLIAKFIEAGTALGNYAKDYHGGNKDYIAIRNQLIADGQMLQTQAGGQPTTAAGSTNSGNANTDSQFVALMSTVDRLAEQLTASQKQVAELTALLDRLLGQGR
jgi:hypothetical protein